MGAIDGEGKEPVMSSDCLMAGDISDLFIPSMKRIYRVVSNGGHLNAYGNQ